ncbi:hypothetical protein VOLCADRAFT_92182 [Volvox carteri f. nagariensis]|uniref:Uncharacterized protein n=1 Tax=Volvox carteri f. nagariensis TaxID=3068 RepID=D8TYT9_VOLCA|nr:uncharacterized protein VOLCADRAFT_92182 [Volvox carteri f. nagariensis]EFJ47371.1 hypothetical protein VOLCADRAFT_92182 [Volvox carteri f. nagariensis]|eukprot:XP_002951560.1 hypothetical protein VOLCADRAFT_92182 [Volvox carteri f. nagariensis]
MVPKADGDSNGSMDSEKDEDDAHEVDDLDMERRRIMARNRAKLIALGISVGVMELQDLAKKCASAHARPRPSKPKADRHQPTEPTRRSTRLATTGTIAGAGAGAGASGGQEAATVNEPLLQLGEHGEAEVQGRGHAGTSARSRGGPGGGAGREGAAVEGEEEGEAAAATTGLSEEEIAAKAEQLRQREASRLRELELEGLPLHGAAE